MAAPKPMMKAEVKRREDMAVEDVAATELEDSDGGSEKGAAWILFLNADGTVQSEQKISETAGGFGGEFFEDGAEHLARPAPRGPEIDERDSFRGNSLFEVFMGQINGGHYGSFRRPQRYPMGYFVDTRVRPARRRHSVA